MANFAHYIRRTISVSSENAGNALPYTENQPDDQGFERPIYHSVPKSSGAAGRAKVGDTFWLFSQLSTPWGKLPPSLDGRIVVKNISRTGTGRTTRIRFEAGDSSEWFPIFNASAVASTLLSRSSFGETNSLFSAKACAIGQALRFPREIANAEVLVAHCKTIISTPLEFVSYRMVDGTKTAFELTRQLADSGKSVFWDRWSLPRRMSERGDRLSHLALDNHIHQKIAGSRWVWGAQSPEYAAPSSYSLLEMELAKELKKFSPYPPSNDA
jgi:hypothetical protein